MCVRMPLRPLTACAVALGLALVLASPALAGDGGEGLLGETDDKIITAFGFALVLFFPLIALFGSLIQSRLERRKEQKRAAAMRRRVGW